MIGTSKSEYVFIRACIFALRAVAPLSIAHLALSVSQGQFVLSKWLALLTVPEASFYLLVYLPRKKRMQQAAIHPPLITLEERRMLFSRCFSDIREPDVLAGWFFDAPVSALQRENVRDWILWAVYGADQIHMNEVIANSGEEVDDYIAQFEKIVGRQFPEGRNERVRSLRMTLDPVLMSYRPLLWYMIVGTVDTLTTLSLYHAGFKQCAAKRWFNVFPPRPLTLLTRQRSLHPQLSYWVRPSRGPSKRGVLFLHGLGIGLWPYLSFLRKLAKSEPDTTILALEFMPISMRMTSPTLGREALVAAINDILTAHGLEEVVTVGHSFGTVVAAHALRSTLLRPRVCGLVLVDPIPFPLHLPYVAYNFVHRPPKRANEWQLWYFASRDPDIARTLARNFFWAEAILFKEELKGVRTAVVLVGADQIVNSEEVRRYLTGEEEAAPVWNDNEGGLEVVWHPELDHSVVFERECETEMLNELVGRYLRESYNTDHNNEVAGGRAVVTNRGAELV